MSFSEILGQKRAKDFLKRVLAKDKIPHAYLFTGIPGIGKTSTAMALAMALNCRDQIDGEACGKCPSCRKIIGGNSPDFLTIKPEQKKGKSEDSGNSTKKPTRSGQNILIEQVRELNRNLSFAPLGNYRVCVIHKAETMTTEAANSFLKTLEEPPPQNILILNAVEPIDLLPTIVSRCQRVPFQPLPVQDIKDWLVEKKGLSEETAIVLARVSKGSLGRALKMQEGDFLAKRQEWLLRIAKLHGLSKEMAFEMALECAEGGNKPAVATSETGGTSMADMLAVWENWYRDLLVVRSGGPSHLLINADFSHELKKIAGNFKVDNLIDSLLIIDQAQRDLRRNRNIQLMMEHTLLGLNRLTEISLHHA